MMDRIIKIVEFDKPQSIIQREGDQITEVIHTHILIEELNEQLLLHNTNKRSEQLSTECVKEETEEVVPRILDFKDAEGNSIDPDYIEMMYEDGEFNFYKVDCHQKIMEVFPIYKY